MGGIEGDRSLTISLPKIGLLDFIPIFVRGDRFDLLIFIQSTEVVSCTNKTTHCENALFLFERGSFTRYFVEIDSECIGKRKA